MPAVVIKNHEPWTRPSCKDLIVVLILASIGSLWATLSLLAIALKDFSTAFAEDDFAQNIYPNCWVFWAL